MADNFGKRFEGVRRQLEEVGYREVTLATSQTGTTDGFLYMDGVTDEISGIPVPTDSTVFITIKYAIFLDASSEVGEVGHFLCGGFRDGAGNVVLLDEINGAGDQLPLTVSMSSAVGSSAAAVTIVATADTTNQAIELTVDQGSGSDVAYVMARAEIICAKNGYSKPQYIR